MTSSRGCVLPECDWSGDDVAGHMAEAHHLAPTGADAALVDATLAMKAPWWTSPEFAEVENMADDAATMAAVTAMPLDVRQYQIANYRYKKYVNTLDGLLLGPDANNLIQTLARKNDEMERGIDPMEKTLTALLDAVAATTAGLRQQYWREPAPDVTAMTDDEAQQYHAVLSNRYYTAAKINQVVTSELAKAVGERRTQWVVNQMLVDANVEIGLPPEPSDIPERVLRDELDQGILDK